MSRRDYLPDALLGDLPDCKLRIDRQWLEEEEAALAFEVLKNELHWEERELVMFGKPVKQPRLTCLYGEPDSEYNYTGSHWKAHSWHAFQERWVDRISKEFGVRPNSVLCNFYRGGNDSVGWHSDVGGNDGESPTIFSLSLGASRTFQIKHNQNTEWSYNILLRSGDLLTMGAPMQHYWKHQVPKEKVAAPRINLTFRVLH